MASLQKITKYVVEKNLSFTVDTADLCQIFGVSPETIRRLSVELGMPKEGANQYNLKHCAKWYIDKLKQQLSETANERLIKEKVILTRAKAKEALLRAQILSNKSIEIEELENQIVLIVGKFKDGLSNISGSLANQVASINEPSEAYEIIENRINECLLDVSEQLEKLCEVEIIEEEDELHEFDDNALFDETSSEEHDSKEEKT